MQNLGGQTKSIMVFSEVAYCVALYIYLLGDRSFMGAAPNLWNNLPLEVRKAPNIDNYKKLLKTFLFKKAVLNI